MSRDVPGKRRSAARAFPLAWRAIDQCDHFSVEHDSFHGIVRVTRTSDAFPDVATLREAHRWLMRTFVQFQRHKAILVWDGRRGKLRNDPEFEAAVKQVLPPITEGWREFVSINNTPVMKVQFSRWTREGTSAPIRGFNSEREALEYALEASGHAGGNDRK